MRSNGSTASWRRRRRSSARPWSSPKWGAFKVKLLFNLETLLSVEENALRAEEAAAVHDLAVRSRPG